MFKKGDIVDIKKEFQQEFKKIHLPIVQLEVKAINGKEITLLEPYTGVTFKVLDIEVEHRAKSRKKRPVALSERMGGYEIDRVEVTEYKGVINVSTRLRIKPKGRGKGMILLFMATTTGQSGDNNEFEYFRYVAVKNETSVMTRAYNSIGKNFWRKRDLLSNYKSIDNSVLEQVLYALNDAVEEELKGGVQAPSADSIRPELQPRSRFTERKILKEAMESQKSIRDIIAQALNDIGPLKASMGDGIYSYFKFDSILPIKDDFGFILKNKGEIVLDCPIYNKRDYIIKFDIDRYIIYSKDYDLNVTIEIFI